MIVATLVVLALSSAMAGDNKQCSRCMMDSCTTLIEAVKNFNATADAEVLFSAFSEVSPFERKLTEILYYRTENQRIAIRHVYHKLYRRHLCNDIDERASQGSIGCPYFFTAILTPLPLIISEYLFDKLTSEADSGRQSTAFLSNIPSCLMRIVRQFYEMKYGVSLEKSIHRSVSGNLKHLLAELVLTDRPESGEVDQTLAKADAEAMKTAIIDNWISDKKELKKMFTERSYSQLREIFRQYDLLRKAEADTNYVSLEDDIEQHISVLAVWESPQNAYQELVLNIRDQPKLLAERLQVALRQDDLYLLVYLVRLSCDINLGDVKAAYGEVQLRHDLLAHPPPSYRTQLLALFRVQGDTTTGPGQQ